MPSNPDGRARKGTVLRPWARDASLAALVVIAATLARASFHDLLGERGHFLFAISAGAVLVWWVRPVVVLIAGLAAVFSARYFFVEPSGAFIATDPAHDPHLAVAGALSALIAALAWSHQRFRDRAAAEARDAERAGELLRAVSENTDDLIFVKDTQGRMLLANPATLRAVGGTERRVIGSTWAAWTPDPAEAAAIADNDRRVIESGRAETFEERYTGPDGDTRIFLSRKQPLRDDQGRVTGLIGTSRDITDREAAHAALRESEARFRTMADHAPVMIWMTDTEGRCVYLSQTWHAYTGQTPAEGLGSGWLDAVHPDDRGAAAAVFAAASRRREPFRLDYRLRHKDGRCRWAIDSAQPRFDADGAFLGYIGSVIDIADRKEAEEARRAAVERYERQVRLFEGVASTTPDFVYIFDPQGRFQYANRRLLEVWGMQLQDVIGKTCRELGYEQWHHDMHMREIAQVIATKAPIKGEVPFKAPLTGIFGVYEYIFTPVIGPDGEVELIAGTTRDITDRKRAEQAIRESEDRYRTLFSSIEQGFCIAEIILDDAGAPADYRILEANPAFVEFTGLRDWSRGTVLELMPELERWWVQTYGRVALTGAPERFENFAGPMGKWFEVHAFRFGPPERLQVAIFFKDITARKRSDDLIRQSEAHLRRVLDNLYAFVAVLTPDGTLSAANRAPLEAAGIAADDVIGKPFWDCSWWNYDPAIQAQLRDAVGRAARGEVVRYDVPVRMAGDSRMWIDFQIAPLRDDSGRVTHLIPSAMDITARREVEHRLTASESFYRQTLESIPGMVFTNTPDGACDYVSAPWVEFTGIPAEQHFGDGWTASVHPDDRARAFAAWRDAVEGRGQFDVEYRVRRYDGEYEWFKIRGRAIRDADSNIARWFGTGVNIHDLKLAEEALRESEERFRIMADGLALLVWVHAPDGSQQFVNQTFCDYFGVTREEMRGGRWTMLTHPDDSDTYVQEFLACLREQRPFHGEVRVRRADGQWRWFESWGRPRYSSTGEFLGIVGASADVTSRLEAEAALRESEARFRIIAETTPDVIFTAHPDGRWDYANPRWYELTGNPKSSALGSGWTASVHPDDRDSGSATWFDAVRSHAPWEHQHRLRRADGQWRWFAARATPLVGDDGRILHWVGCLSDIHDARHAQEVLAGVNERLNAAVVAKSAELEQSYRALRASERMASLGTFAAGMGHDLANLLLPVRTRLEELLEEESLSDCARADIKAVGGSMAHIQSLCRGLRLFAMDPESESEGSTELATWPADLQRVLRTALPSGITLQCRVPVGLPPVAVAPHRLSQAFLNLIQNARDAITGVGAQAPDTPASSPRGVIEIGAELEPGAPNLVRLWVRDDGPGMTDDVRARCIEPFYTTKTRGLGGTGLGLSIVLGIVSKAGGRVEIDSAPGRGTTISMFLPAAPSRRSDGRPPSSGGDAPPRGTALVTTADLRTGAFAASILTGKGYSVRTPTTPGAPDPEDPPDLWLTDATADAFLAMTTKLAGTPTRVIALGGDDCWRGCSGVVVIPRNAPLSLLRRALQSDAPGGEHQPS